MQRGDRRERRVQGPGWLWRFGRAQYSHRNINERAIGRRANLRRVAARSETPTVPYAGMVTLALIDRTAIYLSDVT